VKNNGASTDPNIIADLDIAKNLCAGTDDDVITQRGMALSTFFSSTAKGDALVDNRIVTNDCSFADDAYFCSWE
jgi:hypothetical protein